MPRRRALGCASSPSATSGCSARAAASRIRQQRADPLAQLGHVLRQLVSARWSFAAPEGNSRRRAVRIFHQHAPGVRLHAANAPRGVAQQHDVAGIALDREVLVERADDDLFRLHHHREQRGIRNRAAAGDGRQPRATPPAQTPVDHVAIEIRAIAAALGRDALRQHFQNAVVLFAPQFAIGIGAAHAIEERVFVPVLATAHGDDLLRQDVERRGGNLNAIKIALLDGAHGGRAFHKVVARGGEQPPLGDCSAPVSRAANALQAPPQSNAAN